jgi:hypothetical protein
MFFGKIPRGVKAFRKNYLGGPPISGFIINFYCIFINKCYEICLSGVLYLPSPHLTPLCASMVLSPLKFYVTSQLDASSGLHMPKENPTFISVCLLVYIERFKLIL